MRKEIKVDLKIGRNQSGLSNEDVAHLLGVGRSRVSRLETGVAKPNFKEVIALCLIYGKAPDVLFSQATRRLLNKLKKRLGTMPEEPKQWGRLHEQRSDTLNGLHYRLRELHKEDGDA